MQTFLMISGKRRKVQLIPTNKKGKTMLKTIFVLFVLFFQGIGNLALNQEIWPTKEWTRSTPAEQQLNAKTLDELITLIRDGKKYPDQHSLIIVRNGYLVVEEYFNGFNADRIHMLQSVSKSFTSAVMGMAIEQGYIKSVDEKILDFFPQIKNIDNLDDRKASMKIKDLLTMRSGTDYHERGSDSPHFQLNRLAKGWDRFYLNRPMINDPGTEYLYDSGGVILMSAMLKNRSRMHVDEFAQKYLFTPLGIEKYFWYKNSEKHPHTGGGLNLRPLDMAKFGLLYLRNGKWEDKQVVPEWWVKESFKKHVTFPNNMRRNTTGYGYLWWIQPPDPKGAGEQDIYAARGAYGQFIFVIPEHKMVVAVTGNAKGAAYQNPIEFLYSHILPAVVH